MRLNGWQRLWVVVSILLLISIAFIQIAVWPYLESDTLKELQSPDCKAWREAPSGYFLQEHPPLDSNCYNLRVFSYNRVTLRSVKDYDKYLLLTKIKTMAIVLCIWIGLILTIYAIGWSIGWVIRGFRI
jgi:hypothetical protein